MHNLMVVNHEDPKMISIRLHPAHSKKIHMDRAMAIGLTSQRRMS